MMTFEEDPNMLIMKTPCAHYFHKQCLVRWLKKSGTCPNCRVVFPKEVEEDEDWETDVDDPEEDEDWETDVDDFEEENLH